VKNRRGPATVTGAGPPSGMDVGSQETCLEPSGVSFKDAFAGRQTRGMVSAGDVVQSLRINALSACSVTGDETGFFDV
jgi:hypothetical protein